MNERQTSRQTELDDDKEGSKYIKNKRAKGGMEERETGRKTDRDNTTHGYMCIYIYIYI